MAEGLEKYRADLVKEILAEPDKQKRRVILEREKKSTEYQKVKTERQPNINKEKGRTEIGIQQGWMHSFGISELTGRGRRFIVKKAEELAAQRPEWKKKMKGVGKGSREADFYSPEIVQQIVEDLNKERKPAPLGWLTNFQVAKMFSKEDQMVGESTIKKLVEPYRIINPEWFGNFEDAQKKLYEYYSPELVAILEKKFSATKVAPEGWQTIGDIASKFNRDQKVIRKIAENLRATSPDGFQMMTHPVNGRLLEYISPKLLETINSELEKFQYAPQGWRSMNSIATEYHKSSITIQKFIQNYRTTNPEYFKQFLDQKGRLLEHLAPQLVEAIIKYLNSELPEILESLPEGWYTISSLTEELHAKKETLEPIIKAVYKEYPDWVKRYQSKVGGEGIWDCYSPELKQLVETELLAQRAIPEGWVTISALCKDLGVSYGLVSRAVESQRSVHPDWFKRYRAKIGKPAEFIAPELAKFISEQVAKHEQAPEGWLTMSKLRDKTGADFRTLTKLIEPYKKTNRDWFKVYKDDIGRPREHFSPGLIESLVKQMAEIKPVPQGWLTRAEICRETNENYQVIEGLADKYRADHPEWFSKFRYSNNKIFEYFSPDLIMQIKQDLEKMAKLAPPGWLNRGMVLLQFKLQYPNTEKIVEPYRKSNPEWFQKFRKDQTETEYYAPELVKILQEYAESRKGPPIGWLTRTALARLAGVDPATVEKVLEGYRTSNPEWFQKFYTQKGGEWEHCSPELVVVILENFKSSKTHESFRNRRLKDEFKQFVKDIPDGTTEEAQEFAKLLSVFGTSNVFDILYKFHPKYKGLAAKEVKSILSDYLGEFLNRTRGFSLENLSEVSLEFLEDASFQIYLFEVLKRDAFAFYSQLRKSDKGVDPRAAIDLYLQNIKEKTQKFNSPTLTLVLEKIKSYYDSVFSELAKPSQLVDTLGPNRAFPDFAQAINIRELIDKQKLLIADEMGGGKSASAILAKEYIGVPLAVIVVPSNVTDTWLDYLSDKVTPEGEQVGYFKPGQAPRVLVAEDFNSLQNVDINNYDYVLISQEKLNEKYTEELLKLDFQMLIVDEVHKLKNVQEGVRSKNLMKLAEKIKDQDQYLALLSGTPIPNKVRDVAIVLKLLYPEELKGIEDDMLVRQIIYSDVLDLRAKLLPRMEMKSLAENVEMPQLIEEEVNVDLVNVEQDVYQVLLEEDGLEATEKLKILRQFLLNPEILDATPGLPSAKISRVGKELSEAFQSKNKIVMFVNGYIEGVIKGEDNIISKLGLPPDVEVRAIYGEVSRVRRREIQKELKTADKKILLLVSGQTADVGVDFSAAEEVFFYNEPWTKADERQQLARVYRPGLEADLKSRTFIVNNTIEEGISLYIQAKDKAIQKLLRGIPRTEIENQLLEQDEKQDLPNLEVNPELARYYFSNWDKMMRIFSYVKQIGEKNFADFLSKFGQEYARCYLDLGSRSYQANASRITATFIENSIKARGEALASPVILDLASGPEMLKKHILDEYQDRVISLDLNREHFSHAGNNRVVGSFLNIPVREGSVDYANMNFALHYTQFAPSRGNFERLEALMELNRVLKTGGVGLINMIYTLDYKNEEGFKEILNLVGFEIDEENSGTIEVGKNYKSNLTVIRKVKNLPVAYDEPEAMAEMLALIGKENFSGLKLKESKANLRDTRRIIQSYTLKDKKIDVNFNQEDAEVLTEEQEIESKGLQLKRQHGGIEKIPKDEIINEGFTRILLKDKYILFKRLSKGEGVVVVK